MVVSICLVGDRVDFDDLDLQFVSNKGICQRGKGVQGESLQLLGGEIETQYHLWLWEDYYTCIGYLMLHFLTTSEIKFSSSMIHLFSFFQSNKISPTTTKKKWCVCLRPRNVWVTKEIKDNYRTPSLQPIKNR